jgi:hypothetical protein
MTDLSMLPDRTELPSGEKATEETRSAWPVKVITILLSGIPQSLMVPSQLPETAVAPSGENATEVTISSCEREGNTLCSGPAQPDNTTPYKESTSKSLTGQLMKYFIIVSR